MPVALITGASQGLGRAVAGELAARRWTLVVDARSGADLETLRSSLPAADIHAIAGDVTDEAHRAALVQQVDALGGLDLLVNNASMLGPSPQPELARYPLDVLRRVYETDVIAPLALVQALLPALKSGRGAILNISSDAAVEAYEGWGGYGSAKAALDQATAVLAVEQPDLDVYAFDPGDMRTQMHQAAFPGEDISDRPEPSTVVPAVMRLVDERPASGRYRAAALLADLPREALTNAGPA
jgi:NAD(P)-dependent dehydrogenase (short-subunit alcohol dehydrogenase family)